MNEMETLIAPVPVSYILEEIGHLKSHGLLFSRGKFEVFLAPATAIPHLLKEIGRLRELTFRKVGEGTGKAYDVDEFDQHYHNLFIWDQEESKVVGGYRLGPGAAIFENQGIGGFYINSLFNINSGFYPILKQSIELGRSYIIPEYQKGFLPLFLLWRGILTFLQRNPQYRYLIGPVSISKYYSNISKSLIIAFVKKYCFDLERAAYFVARTPFKPEIDQKEVDSALNQLSGNIKDLENFLQTIEPTHLKVPVLLKQYVRQNAKFLSFNIDPNFSDALDGLMLLDLKNVPKETIELLNGK